MVAPLIDETVQNVIKRLVALLTATLAAVATFVISAALPVPFWATAALALVAFLGASTWLLRRLVPGVRGSSGLTPRGWWWLGGGAALYMLLAQLLVGRPPRRTLEELGPPSTASYWTLADGLRLAYVHVKPPVPTEHPPILVLHEGPGIPGLPMYEALGRRPLDFLAEAGHAVYYYDLLGAGYSGRLDLSSEARYTVARHVADVEEIRQLLGAPSIVLVGTGWGASLAIHYLLKFPDKVSRLVLESPAPLWAPAWPDAISPTARARMTDVQAAALAAMQRPTLRLVLGRMMADFSQRSAHRFIADWEADQWWTRLQEESLRLGQPNLTCFSDPGRGVPAPNGLGFFANSYTLSDALSLPDPRPALARLTTNILIIRGSCDYIAWPVSEEYLSVLPGARYVAIPAAGHFVWLEQPMMYREVVQAFFRDEPLPLEAYSTRRRAP